jgi:hypothetical protein
MLTAIALKIFVITGKTAQNSTDGLIDAELERFGQHQTTCGKPTIFG